MTSNPEYQFFLADEAETLKFGARLSGLLRAGDVIALSGDLGMGKTTLTRGLIRSLIEGLEELPSPTFTLVQTYECPEFLIWHFDLYRLEDPSEVIEIGFEDALDDVCLIEWPEKAGHYLPRTRLTLRLDAQGDGRIATLMAGSEDWADRLGDFFGHDGTRKGTN